jgi:hypothetical protein
MAIPTLLYGSETWTLKEQDKTNHSSREKSQNTYCTATKGIKISQRNSKHNQFRKKSTTIKTNAYNTDRSRLPNAIMKYQPARKRNPGRPLKRLLDCYIETGAGHNA